MTPLHLWIVTQYFPPDTGAAAVRLSRLARLLVADGHRVTVLTVMPHYSSNGIADGYRGRVFMRERIDGADVLRGWVYAGGKGTAARLLNQISAMCAVALHGTFAARPDVILVESHPLFMAIAGGWLKRVKRATVVLNVSDLWPESAVETGTLAATHPLVRLAMPVAGWAYRDAAQIVGMTDGVIAGIRRHGADPAKVSLIANGVDLDFFQPRTRSGMLRARFGIEADRVVALHIGNLSTTYDFETLLDAAALCPDVSFVYVGTGSKADDVQADAARRGLRNVYFTGVLAYNLMPDVWADGDLCLIAMGDHALAAGTRPAKLYEALATGTPIIAAIRGEGARLIEESGAGVVVPVGDADALSAAIRSLADDPGRRATLGAAGRRYAEAHLSADVVKDRYLDVIRRVV
ncbi:MAG: glycosyltransferase family 4 protein [Chloroflexota bacterium]|nr:glycosyltransferase family 4 protein [Chloroflexota bacterium]